MLAAVPGPRFLLYGTRGSFVKYGVDPQAEAATDIGNVGRNVLRGPPQWNLDFSVSKQFPVTESKSIEFSVDFFNLINHPNRDNPVSDISTSDFGKILNFSSSPRIVQLALQFKF